MTRLARHLSALGYGTRREVDRLFTQGAITDAGGRRLHPDTHLSVDAVADAPTHTSIRVLGEPLDPPPGSVVLLHKPAGVVCSTVDPNPVVYDLLPPRFRERSPVMAPVGRLDRDTTGVLLLTDNGALLHRLTSPKSHLPKRYQATLTEPFQAQHIAALTDGTLQLDGEHKPLAAAQLEQLGECEVQLTITEGRYHQVRRMFAAVGYHVRALHRWSVGPITLGALAEGEWRVLRVEERQTLEQALTTARAMQRAMGHVAPDATGELPPTV